MLGNNTTWGINQACSQHQINTFLYPGGAFYRVHQIPMEIIQKGILKWSTVSKSFVLVLVNRSFG